ncbi:hypothetical protein ABIF74_008832 [Bradyrhizobium japonicum]
MSIAALRDENEQLKALLAQTQAALSEHQGALAASEEARRRRACHVQNSFRVILPQLSSRLGTPRFFRADQPPTP